MLLPCDASKLLGARSMCMSSLLLEDKSSCWFNVAKLVSILCFEAGFVCSIRALRSSLRLALRFFGPEPQEKELCV